MTETDSWCLDGTPTLHGQRDGVDPRPLLRPLLHHAHQLPAVVRGRGNQSVLAAHRHRAVRSAGGAGGMVPAQRRLPLDGGGGFTIHRLALGHHHRLGAGLDRDHPGRVLGFSCGRTDRRRRVRILTGGGLIRLLYCVCAPSPPTGTVMNVSEGDAHWRDAKHHNVRAERKVPSDPRGTRESTRV